MLCGWAFGGSATQAQTAIGNAAGESADIANAMLTTAFNLVIFGGAAVRRLPHRRQRPRRSPTAMIALSAVAVLAVASSRRPVFPK